MKRRKFIDRKQAVAGVIEALLLVALVSIIISTIQLVYIPQMMEQKEAEHMDLVSNQFSYLKSMIDIQYMTDSTVPISSMITLGSRELPYFITARAFGELSLYRDEKCNITITENHPWFWDTTYPLTSIKYEAYNSYFVDQTYAIEGGGIFVKQPNGKSVSRARASISLTNASGNPFISFDLPKFIGISDIKNSTYGHGKCMIRTNFSKKVPDNRIDNVTINITTFFPNAWNESFQNLEDASYLLNITTYESPGTTYPPYVVIKASDGKTLDARVTEIHLYAQIGPGWVE